MNGASQLKMSSVPDAGLIKILDDLKYSDENI